MSRKKKTTKPQRSKQLQKKTPKLSIGIDLGSGYLAICIYDGRKFTFVTCPLNGTQIPTVIYLERKTGKKHIGKAAWTHCFDGTGDLFTHMKRNMFESPEEKLYAGKYTPVEVLTWLLEYVVSLLLTIRPELSDYRQFGGNKRPADDLAITFAIPASWSISQQTYFEKAIKAAGFNDFDGFVAEPVAAARRASHLHHIRLKNKDRVLVIDNGAGTTDIALMQFEDDVYNQLAPARGNAYLAGHDFTAVLAEHIAKENRVPWRPEFYGKGGLDLSSVSQKLQQQVIACWSAGEECKKQLSVLLEVTVAVDLPKGRRTCTITREKAATLWAPLLAKLKTCVSKALDGTELDFPDVQYIILGGGSSLLPGAREGVAEVVKRDVSDIIVCSDSEHIVSAGAAELGLRQEDSQQALESGLGVTVIDADTGAARHLLMISPGELIPADGLYLKHQEGFRINTTGGKRHVLIQAFVCKPGVRAAVVPGRETFLKDSEVLPLEPVEAELEHFPDGDHAVSVGIKVDPSRNLWMLIRPTSLRVEALSVRLSMSLGKGERKKATAKPASEVLLVLDCSGSMAGEKIGMLQEGATRFAKVATANGANLAVLVFPYPSDEPPSPCDAKLVCAFTSKQQDIAACIEAFEADAGTPMSDALGLAGETFESRPGDAERIALLFSDGQPQEPDATQTAATQLKQSVRLITVGIGEDVETEFLRGLASTPDDYHYAKAPENILDAFEEVLVQLRWKGTNGRKPHPKRQPDVTGHKEAPRVEATEKTAEPDTPEELYEEDWDDIEEEELV